MVLGISAFKTDLEHDGKTFCMFCAVVCLWAVNLLSRNVVICQS